MSSRRYVPDGSVWRSGNVVLGGSPLTLFRLTDAGAGTFERIESGEDVDDSPLVRRLLNAGAIHPVVERSPSGFDATDVTIVTPAFSTTGHSGAGTIVVDDGSDPPLPSATVRLGRNRGPAAARNAGLVHVTTDLVAFVDTDVELPAGWLDHLLPHFDDGGVVAVAPRIVSAPGRSALARWEAGNSPLDLGAEPARVRSGTRVSYVPGAAIVCRTDAVRDVGGFDESLRFGEDVDLVWRLDEAGGTVRYEPAVTVWHDPRSDWIAWLRQRAGYGTSAGPLARRHPGALAPLRISGWTAVAWSAAAAGAPLLGASVAVGSSAALVRKLRGVPPGAAFLVAWRGNLRGGEQIAAAVRRVWWPVVTLLALRSRIARRVLVASVVAAGHPVRVADDVAYGVGVWRGMARARTLAPLVPEISSWPGRSRPPQRAAAR